MYEEVNWKVLPHFIQKTVYVRNQFYGEKTAHWRAECENLAEMSNFHFLSQIPFFYTGYI